MKRMNGTRMKGANAAVIVAAASLACGAAWGGPLDKAQTSVNQARAKHQASKKEDVAQDRSNLEKMAMQAVEELRHDNANAAKMLDMAYGYAVFDTTKGGLIVTGLGGTGVAMKKGGGNESFMHVGGGGVGLGAGLSNYKLILLIKDKSTYDKFVNGKWDASASAQAVAGNAGASSQVHWQDGVIVYRLTDAGLIAQADISGMKFWPADRLNKSA
ncbi:MAG TPA: YSC84-related protein [Gammaproteobacteria bacterium]|nr:YSC84-related protein [Gammaproteobacteria bacterium]